MNPGAFTRKFYKKNFRDNYDIIGEDLTKRIIHFTNKGYKPEDLIDTSDGGRDFDYTFALQTLANLAGVVALCYTMYETHKSKDNSDDRAIDLITDIILDDKYKIDPEIKNNLIRDLRKELKK